MLPIAGQVLIIFIDSILLSWAHKLSRIFDLYSFISWFPCNLSIIGKNVFVFIRFKTFLNYLKLAWIGPILVLLSLLHLFVRIASILNIRTQFRLCLFRNNGLFMAKRIIFLLIVDIIMIEFSHLTGVPIMNIFLISHRFTVYW